MLISRAALAACVLVLAACSDDAPPVAAVPQVKAEDLVKFTKGFACGTSDQFTQALTHSVSGEKTKFAAMFEQGTCWATDHDATFRVLHVEYGRIEFAPNVESPDSSAWTAPEFATVQPAVSKS